MNKNDICITGSVVDGTYEYYGITRTPNGLVWKNPVNTMYLFPWDYGTTVNWRVGSNWTKPGAYISCTASSATSNGVYAFLDSGCNGNWYDWDSSTSQFVPNPFITSTQGACTDDPTTMPTPAPTYAPTTSSPTRQPTLAPSDAPTFSPTLSPISLLEK